MSILVTGGAGYIGSHTCVELLNNGRDVIVLDNLVNSSKIALQRVEQITGKKLKFYQGDCCLAKDVYRVFKENKIEAVIHFAGLKSPLESIYKPLEYYDNNLTGTFVLLKIMQEFNCYKFIFSSSATVYGEPEEVPIKENAKKGEITNPYGKTKAILEDVLQDIYQADKRWQIVLLRYFNPIGAHESGLIGENPKGIPANLLPYITQVAVHKLAKLSVFGNDYPTPDGTCLRDYIHVVDLAKGHVKALNVLDHSENSVHIYNLGTGKACSVLEVIHTFEQVNQVQIPYEIKERRKGDVASSYADPHKAYVEMHWQAQKTLADMCRDSWRWQKNNPNGYE